MNRSGKIALTILGAVAITGTCVLIYRANVPPSFSIEDVDLITKFGTVHFGGTSNNFDLNGGKSIAGYGNWSLVVAKTIDGKNITFNLYKNGQFVKTLQTV